MTYRFNSDYTEGCHPAVLENSCKPTWNRLTATALIHTATKHAN